MDKQEIKEAIQATLHECGITFALKQYQEDLLLHFLNDNDTIGVLPTGYGKSIVFQIAPKVFKKICSVSSPLVIVVSPINALIEDQIASCKAMNIKASFLCKENISSLEINDPDDGSIEILYSSPECLVDDHYRDFLLSMVPNVIGIVVDEAHLVIKW